MIGAILGAITVADPNAPAPSKPPAYRLADTDGPLFLAAELEVYRAGGASAGIGIVLGEAPIGQVPPVAVQAEDFDTWRASDLGYVTRRSDAAGTRVFTPTLGDGFAFNRLLDLAPGGTGASASWGALRFIHGATAYDTAGRNADNRAARVYLGRKAVDATRGRFTDPSAADLAEVFTGLAQAWQTDERGVTVPLQGPSAWLSRALQASTYAGTGTAEGTADLTGRAKPKARGGASGAPIRGIEPLLIDPTNNVWQWSDAPGAITALYENGAQVFTYAGDTANLWAGSTPAGNFRTDAARSMLQLGSPRAGRITLDGIAQFPAAGLVSTAAGIALALLDELTLPAGTVDRGSFVGLDAAFPYSAGWWWSGGQTDTGAGAVALMLASIGARLVPSRSGRLRGLALRAPVNAVPAATYTTAHITACQRADLPPGSAPPPYRLRFGYGRNFTVMNSSDLNATVTDGNRAYFATVDRFAAWSSAAVLTAWRRPSDPDPIPSALLVAADAQAVVQALGALWGTERRLYAVTLPVQLGVRHDLGDALTIAYPLDSLTRGQLGQVVGEQLRMQDSTTTLMVLV